MIQSFRCKETERIYNREGSRKLPHDIQRVALRKLVMLGAAHDWRDLKAPPGNYLEELKDDRKGRYSIRINRQWRICFKWRDGNAHEVEIVDYH